MPESEAQAQKWSRKASLRARIRAQAQKWSRKASLRA